MACRVGLCGNLKKIAQIPGRVRKGTSHMVGMGIAPEGTGNDPAKYDLWGEMMWESEDIDVEKWLDSYIERPLRCGNDGRQSGMENSSEYRLTPILNTSRHRQNPSSAPCRTLMRPRQRQTVRLTVTTILRSLKTPLRC